MATLTQQSLIPERHTQQIRHLPEVSSRDQAARARQLFAAVILTAIDDAIAEQQISGGGAEHIARWARSQDGQCVLSCAGIDPSERVAQALKEFVLRGQRTATGDSAAAVRMRNLRASRLAHRSTGVVNNAQLV